MQQLKGAAGRIEPSQVAVIVPAYNSAGTISRSIESILHQTVGPLAVIVIDDGSQDDTSHVVESEFPQVRLIKKENGGAASARNAGLRASAAFDWIAFIDADDWWHPEKIERQLDALNSFPGSEVSYTRCLPLCEAIAQQRSVSANQTTSSVLGFRDVFLDPYWGTPSVLVSRTAVEEVGGFDESLVAAEDVDLWLKLGVRTPVVRVDLPLVGIDRREAGLTSTVGVHAVWLNLLVIERFLQQFDWKGKISRVDIRRIRSIIYTRMTAMHLAAENTGQALEASVHAILQWPFSARLAYLFLKAAFRSLVSGKGDN